MEKHLVKVDLIGHKNANVNITNSSGPPTQSNLTCTAACEANTALQQDGVELLYQTLEVDFGANRHHNLFAVIGPEADRHFCGHNRPDEATLLRSTFLFTSVT